MKKNGIIKKILSISWFLLVAILLGGIYWSFLLQEEKLQKIEASFKKLEDIVRSRLHPVGDQIGIKKKEKHGFTSYPGNFLQIDPYYKKTLPTLLGDDFKPHGTLRLGSVGRADNLHPFSEWAYVSEWVSYVQRSMMGLQFGKYRVLAPEIAYSIEQEDDEKNHCAVYIVHLRDDVYWQPLDQAHFPASVRLAPHFLRKHRVTAYDFQFFYQAVNNPHVDVAAAVTLRQLMQDIETLEVVDDYTLKIYYKKKKFIDDNVVHYKLPYVARVRIGAIQPLARFVYQYGPDGNKLCSDDSSPRFYQKSSVWAQQFAHHFALGVIPSCGPYIFDGATSRSVRFIRDAEFYAPLQALYEAIEVNLVDNPDVIWRDFMAQKIDLCTLPPQSFVEFDRFKKSTFYQREQEKGLEANSLEYLGRSFSYVAFNLKRPYFSSVKVRQALSMAIDYQRMIHQNLYDQAVTITGPFFKESGAYNKNVPEWPYDVKRAKLLLAEEGWYDSDGDGFLDKEIDGARIAFRFSLIYFVKNPISKAFCEMISQYFRAIGIDCRLRGLDIADLSASIEDKSFDALFLAWQLSTPPEDPEQLWSSKVANEKGSSNIVSFSNIEVDALIDRLTFESNEEERTKLYHRIHKIIHDEAPYLFLFTPKVTVAYWNRIQNFIIPKDHQHIIPGADVVEPSPLSTWKTFRMDP